MTSEEIGKEMSKWCWDESKCTVDWEARVLWIVEQFLSGKKAA